MHWELTPIVVLGLLAFGLYQAAKDVKNTHKQPVSPPDLIQDTINAGAAEVVLDGVSETVLPTAIPAIVHVAEAIAHHANF
jgi:hypothetical protein